MSFAIEEGTIFSDAMNAEDPQEYFEQTLARMLGANAATQFGVELAAKIEVPQ